MSACPLKEAFAHMRYSKICLKGPLNNRQNKGLNGKWKLNEGLKYCLMLQVKHIILLTCIKQ